MWKPWRQNRFSAPGSPPIPTNQSYNDHINSFYSGIPKGNFAVVPFQRAVQVYSHCQRAQLIFQPRKCGGTLLCVSLVNTETKIGFQCKLMINVWIFQTSPSTGSRAKSHTCTMNASRGRLLGYLLLLGTYNVVVKAKLISRLLDAWMCLAVDHVKH